MYCPSVVLAFCMFQTRTKPEPHQNSTKQPPTTGPSSPPFYVLCFSVFGILRFLCFCVLFDFAFVVFLFLFPSWSLF